MTLRVEPSHFKPDTLLPGSKSHANRFLILAARIGDGVVIRSLPQSEDVQYLLLALKKIGLQIDGADAACFKNKFPECEKKQLQPIEIEVGEGGTTARFLLVLLASGKNEYVLKMKARLSERPWDELIDALKVAGAKIEWLDNQLHVQGPIELAKLPQSISAARSTQFASALKLAFHQDGYNLRPEELKTSQAYWQMTLDCCQEIAKRDVNVPLDWSSAAYPLVFAAVSDKPVKLAGLKKDAQADSILFDLLKERGAITQNENGIQGHGLKTRPPLDLSISSCPDLSIALAYLCSHLKGKSVLRDVSVLRHKESDRLQALLDLLKHVQIEASYDQSKDTLEIVGGEPKAPASLSVPADHRLVMVGVLFLMKSGGTITHSGAVNKSFPQFFEQIIRER
ncbi:MAG: 3-phosphoshikimate 1-carboxyvinyltransferase [Bacteriovoracia bacterium]